MGDSVPGTIVGVTIGVLVGVRVIGLLDGAFMPKVGIAVGTMVGVAVAGALVGSEPSGDSSDIDFRSWEFFTKK